ncbi:MAG: hypothetical protein WA894_04750 [Candidatus Acidiferrum sp.]
MRNATTRTRPRKNQSGYALLVVVFLTTVVLIASMSIGLRILTEGRREKEKEMIWRGKQYTRGIKLYYAKFGRFPTSLDDLTKPSNGNIRFMRQAYKDPMNKDDGSWRLIYVGPAGQLIGSLKPPQGGIQMPGAPGQPSGIGTSTSSFGSTPGTSDSVATTGFGSSSSSSAPGSTGFGTPTAGSGTNAQGTDTSNTPTDAQGVATGDTPTIVGGSIIGIGSKVNKPSIMVYETAKNYHLFEFIWDPSKDLGMIGAPAAPIGTPAGSPGQTPFGSQPNPSNPQTNPPTSNPVPNPNPQQQQ